MNQEEIYEKAKSLMSIFTTISDVKAHIELLLQDTEDQFYPEEVKKWNAVFDQVNTIHLENHPENWHMYSGKQVKYDGEDWKLISVRALHEQLQLEQRNAKEGGGVQIVKTWVRMSECRPIEIIDINQLKFKEEDGEDNN